MHFYPQIINNLFTPEEQRLLRETIDSKSATSSWNDKERSRGVRKYSELDEYFGKIVEDKAKEIFSEPELKSTYSVYFDYDKPTSKLHPHRDNNACTFTIDYCVSAKTPWGVVVEDEEFVFEPGQALAFMGGHDAHWRNDMPDPETNRVEVVMFHFCLPDHWYFTEGPDYVYVLEEAGTLRDFDSYDLSPQLRKNTKNTDLT